MRLRVISRCKCAVTGEPVRVRVGKGPLGSAEEQGTGKSRPQRKGGHATTSFSLFLQGDRGRPVCVVSGVSSGNMEDAVFWRICWRNTLYTRDRRGGAAWVCGDR